MAKIIHLHNSEQSQNTSTQEERFHDLIHVVSDMNNLLQRIEKSLQNTPKLNHIYASKDINSRG